MNNRNPWAWVPTLYFAEGVPYVAVMTISVIIYKRLGLSNADITLYTSWLYLPWVIKPLWSPFVDMLRTKRWWILVMQILIAAALAGVAFTIPGPWWLQGSLAFFWLLAFSSATHDIAADGFYMLGLEQHNPQYFLSHSHHLLFWTIGGLGRRSAGAYAQHCLCVELGVLPHCRTVYCLVAVPQLGTPPPQRG